MSKAMKSVATALVALTAASTPVVSIALNDGIGAVKLACQSGTGGGCAE